MICTKTKENIKSIQYYYIQILYYFEIFAFYVKKKKEKEEELHGTSYKPLSYRIDVYHYNCEWNWDG